MKILHIGKEGNIARFCAAGSIFKEAEIMDLPANLPAEEYIKAAPDAEHIIVDAICELPGEVIRGLQSLQSIHSEGVAYNRIDLETARACGITVCNSRGMNASAVAEQALLLMLSLLKDFINGDKAVREGYQIETKEGYMSRGDLLELSDLSVGLVGLGNIGSALARLLRAHGVENIYYSDLLRLPLEQEELLGVIYLPLDELLAASDIVSLHVPVTDGTFHMADSAFFEKMKEGAYFVNTARGELVDNEALIQALRKGKLKGAGLDTLDNEPVKRDHPLLMADDISDMLIFSPHIGGITAASFRRSFKMIEEDILTVRRGEKPDRAV